MGGISGLSALDQPSLTISPSSSAQSGPAYGYQMPKLTMPVNVTVGGPAASGSLGTVEVLAVAGLAVFLALRYVK